MKRRNIKKQATKKQTTSTKKEIKTMNETVHTTNANPKTVGLCNAISPDMLSPDKLSDIIPKNEQAVTETDLASLNTLTVVDIIEPLDVSSKIPDEEREAIDDAITKNRPDLTEAINAGYFSPVSGMKGFITDTEHKIFAKIFIDLHGERFLEYMQQYRSGDFSACMKIAQSDLMVVAMYGFTTNKEKETGENTASLKNKARKILLKIAEDYYSKLLYLEEGLNIEAVLNLLVRQYKTLPVETETAPLLERPSDLYAKIIETIKENWPEGCFEQNAYYALDNSDIDSLEYFLDIPKKTLIAKMAEYNFLYLAESSKGYQTNVRFKASEKHPDFFPKPYTKWCYCLWNFEYIAKTDAQKRAK